MHCAAGMEYPDVMHISTSSMDPACLPCGPPFWCLTCPQAQRSGSAGCAAPCHGTAAAVAHPRARGRDRQEPFVLTPLGSMSSPQRHCPCSLRLVPNCCQVLVACCLRQTERQGSWRNRPERRCKPWQPQVPAIHGRQPGAGAPGWLPDQMPRSRQTAAEAAAPLLLERGESLPPTKSGSAVRRHQGPGEPHRGSACHQGVQRRPWPGTPHGTQGTPEGAGRRGMQVH